MLLAEKVLVFRTRGALRSTHVSELWLQLPTPDDDVRTRQTPGPCTLLTPLAAISSFISGVLEPPFVSALP